MKQASIPDCSGIVSCICMIETFDFHSSDLVKPRSLQILDRLFECCTLRSFQVKISSRLLHTNERDAGADFNGTDILVECHVRPQMLAFAAQRASFNTSAMGDSMRGERLRKAGYEIPSESWC